MLSWLLKFSPMAPEIIDDSSMSCSLAFEPTPVPLVPLLDAVEPSLKQFVECVDIEELVQLLFGVLLLLMIAEVFEKMLADDKSFMPC